MAETSTSPLLGSARPRAAHTKLVQPVDAKQKICASLVIRPPPDSPPMPDIDHWGKTSLRERRFMTPSEYADVYGATKSDMDAVNAFATAQGLEILDSHAGRRTVSVAGTAAQLNAAFNVQLNNYEAPLPQGPRRHASGANRAPIVGTYIHHSFDGPIHIPTQLVGVVVGVVGLDNRTLGGPSGTGDPPGATALPVSTVASHYNFPNASAGNQVIGIHAPQRTPQNGASYLSADVFQLYFDFKNVPARLNDIDLTVGTNTFSNNPAAVQAITASTNLNSFPASWIIEVTQDICTSATTAQGAQVNIYFTELSEQGWLVFLNRVLIPDGEVQPTVVSSSFWSWASDDPSSIGAFNVQGTAANLMSSLFQQLAVVGINVFVTAGDYGSNAGVLDGKTHLQYAGSDPWATSCGGTMIGQSSGVWNEWAWSDANSPSPFGSASSDFGATGGGVSANFPIPPYQTAAGITQMHDSNNNILKGRFVPDVSGMVACNGFFVNAIGYSFTGTSCVAPYYAGLFATLQNIFGTSLGFLNPILYQLAAVAFNDVTNGNNDSGDTPSSPYFIAGTGYDACTGLGSIDGTKMLNGIASLLYTPAFYFVMDKSTFGLDEVTNVSTYPNAFLLVLEGFAPASLPVGGPTLSGPWAATPNVTTSVGAAQPEIATNPFTPQRIVYPCLVTFSLAAVSPTSQGGIFPNSGSPPIQVLLTAEITPSGATMVASTVIELISGADPYFTNINPSENNVFWLSQDLRVFPQTPGLGHTSIGNGSPTLSPSSPTVQDTAAGYQYIQSLITFFNANFSDPAVIDPFTLLPDQSAALTGDSSITPSEINPSDPFGPRLTIYNFALARVRLTGTPNTSTVIPVKVFFRLWVSSTCDTDYDPTGTYPFIPDSAGLPTAPLAGATIPFFATGNYVSNADFKANFDYTAPSVNNKVINIGSSGSVWAYYGCFLNMYPTTNVVNGKPIAAQLAGSHHCLVAQIAFDQAPIVNSNGVTASPDNSDKLAQRNLQITLSDNPGPPSTHRIPQAFDVRPSPPISTAVRLLLNYPDELMIDWANTPIGSKAKIYWPAVKASDVLALAKQLYSTHQLSEADEHTIECIVPRGKTYVPIPAAVMTNGGNFAGLFTVDLPPGIVEGQTFNIVVRRISTRRIDEERLAAVSATEAKVMSNWRYVVGTFGVRIPVSTAAVVLPSDEDTLAILKWRLGELAQDDRWHPVMQRYVSIVAGRIEGLGGNPGSIKPSPGGAGHGRRHRHRKGLWGNIRVFCFCGCF